MSPEEDLARILTSDAVGTIFACNMLASVRENLFDQDRLQIVLGYLLQWFKTERASFTSATSVIGAINRITSGFTAYTTERCLLACPVSDLVPHASRYAHACRSDLLTTCWLDVDSDPDLFLEPAPRKGEEILYGEALEAINEKIRNEPNVIKANASLGFEVPTESLLGLGWVISEDRLSSHWNSGDRVRDVLGLIDLKPDTFHIVLVFDSSKLGTHPMARPTFADGGNTRFRITPDVPGLPDWGMTVDLGQFAAGETIVDGLPERVIPPIALRTLVPQFKAIGWVTTMRGTTDKDSDVVFAQRLLKGSSLPELEKSILRLFNQP